MNNSNEAKITVSAPKQIEPGVFDFSLKLSESLEPRRNELRNEIIEAQRNLHVFAEKNGWSQLMSKPLADSAEIYATKPEWDARLRQIVPDAPKDIPKTFSAAIEGGILLAVSPDVYFANYPDGKSEPNAFRKLITHEFAHRLHVRICKGKEEKMGPMWFFEGFAIYAANQLNQHPPKLSEKEIWAIANAKERGSYLKYNAVFRHFLGSQPLPKFVDASMQNNFVDKLRKR